MDDQIPKKIHYCWFGFKEMPDSIKKCIISWKKILPDYEIKLWNERDFDIEQSLFVKQAYEKGKFAFVSDYVRLYALYTEGGIYMDTDVEVIKSLDPFLKHSSFLGSESDEFVSTGIIGATKGHPLIKRLLDYYREKSFVKNDGSMELITNVHIITRILKLEYNWEPRIDKLQLLKNDVYIYPTEYFSPKDWRSGEISITKNSHVIHYYNGSWLEKASYLELFVYSIKVGLFKFLKKERYQKLKRKLKFINNNNLLKR